MGLVHEIANKLFLEEDCKPLEVFKHYVPEIYKDISWASLAPKIEMVLGSYIEDCIDECIIDLICEITSVKVDDRTSLQKKALEALRKTVGYFAAFDLIKIPGSGISDQGAVEGNGQGKVRSLDRQRYNDAKYALCDCAYDCLEDLIFKIIIPNIEDFGGTEKEVYQKFCALMITSPKEFAKYQKLANPGRLRHFLCLIPFMEEAIEELEDCLGCEYFFCKLPEYLKNGNTKKELKFKKKLQRFISTRTMLNAANRTTLIFTSQGYKILDGRPYARAGSKTEDKCNRDRFADNDKKHLKNLMDWLMANPDCYPEWNACCVPEETEEDCGCGEHDGGCNDSRVCCEEETVPDCIIAGDCATVML